MDYRKYVRKPFTVEAIEVTEYNIAELAPLVGTLCEKADGTPFIKADRRLVHNSYRVYPGWFITKRENKTRCYSPKIFNNQFAAETPEIMDWVDFMNAPEVVKTPVDGVMNPLGGISSEDAIIAAEEYSNSWRNTVGTPGEEDVPGENTPEETEADYTIG